MGAWSPLAPEPNLATARAMCERLQAEAAVLQLDVEPASPIFFADVAAGTRHLGNAQLQALLDHLAEQLHAARLVQDLPSCISRCHSYLAIS